MSLAVDFWCRLCRPEALRKVVRVMPSVLALLVMSLANSISVPACASASTTAASLADFVTKARIASRTFILSPFFSPSFDGGMPAARLEALSFWSSFSRPALKASKVR